MTPIPKLSARRVHRRVEMSKTYWLIERNQKHGEPTARWFSERRCFNYGDSDLWVQDVTRAQRFDTKELAEASIRERFLPPCETYPVLPEATEHMDVP